MMDMGNDGPAVIEQRPHNGCADPLAAARDDCCPLLIQRTYHPVTPSPTGLLMPERRAPIEAQGLSLADLATAIRRAEVRPRRSLEPFALRQFDMRIARDGRWYYRVRRLSGRQWSGCLPRPAARSGRHHVLVTPVEKLAIEGEATAFRATQMTMTGEREHRRIGVTLDSGDALIIGPNHALSIIESADGPSPRIAVRFGLEAELARPLYYELAEIALEESHDPPGVWSNGAFFPLVP